jgi:hypothetical protein
MQALLQAAGACSYALIFATTNLATFSAHAQTSGLSNLPLASTGTKWKQLTANDWAKLDRRFDYAIPKELAPSTSLTIGNCYAMDPPSPECARVFKEKYQAMMVRTAAGANAGSSDQACATKADVIAAIQQVQGSSGDKARPKMGPATDPGRQSVAGKKADDYDGSRPVTLKTYDEWEKQVKKELDEEEKKRKEPKPEPTPDPKKK